MARNDINYKEYTRLRDIAQKRLKRLGAAGFNTGIQIPTVKEVRGSQNPYWFFAELKKFVDSPTTVSAVRKTVDTKSGSTHGRIYQPKFPRITAPATVTAEEKKQKRRAGQRRSRQRKAALENAPEKLRGRFAGYLKSAEAIADRWMREGEITGLPKYFEMAKLLREMTPTQAKAFVEYTEYRFSQGNFGEKYKIDDFTTDYVKLLQSGKRNVTANIERDFERFLADQKIMERNRKETLQYGITLDELDKLWQQFVKV